MDRSRLLLNRITELQKSLFQLPSKRNEGRYLKVVYVRYANDFLIEIKSRHTSGMTTILMIKD